MVRIRSLWSRPTLYYNIDGVGEMSFGLFLLGSALLLWLQAHTPQDSVLHKTLLIGFFALLAILEYGSKAIKKHITYPRTGFVEYRRHDRIRNGVLAALVTIAIFLVWVAASRWHWDLAIPARLMGLPFVAAYVLSIARMFPWKWAVVALMVAGSFVIALQMPDPADALLLNCIVYGTILMAAGSITLWLYLHRTQPPAQEAQ